MRSARQVVAEMASSPRFWSASCARLRSRSVCRECDVRADEAAPCGVNKRRAHDDMDVVERLGRKLTPGPAATGEEVVVETVDVFDAKAAQVNVADARSEGSPPQPDQPGRTAIALGRPLITIGTCVFYGGLLNVPCEYLEQLLGGQSSDHSSTAPGSTPESLSAAPSPSVTASDPLLAGPDRSRPAHPERRHRSGNPMRSVLI